MYEKHCCFRPAGSILSAVLVKPSQPRGQKEELQNMGVKTAQAEIACKKERSHALSFKLA